MIKSFTKYILTLVAVLMVTTNAWAWRGAKAIVISEPTLGGWVCVADNAPSSWSLKEDSQTKEDTWAVGNKNFTFYRHYKCETNFIFKGWSEDKNANTGTTTSSCSISGNLTGYNTKTYYAIFATLQYPANKDVVFADTKKDEELSQTIVIKHAHAGNLTLSLSDNTNFKITSASSINSVSLNANQEVIVTFCPKTTGNHTATLTIKSDNGLSDLTITLKGKATDIYTPVAEKKVDEIFKNASYPLNEVFDVYYLANDQKNPLNDYTINALNPHIANCIDGTIYTNHNTGSAGFVLTRAANSDFYALNETIYVEVTANNQDCDLPISSTSTTTTNNGPGYSNPINLNGSGKTLTFTYRLNEGAGATHYITPQYSTTENADDFQNISNDNTYNTKTTTPTTQSLNLPAGTKRIRFKRTSDWTGNKYFIISDISVTRNTSLAATQTFTEDKPLTLPPVAINQQSSANFYINWSTCSNIQLACDNSKFTISPSSFSAAEGTEQKIAVSCNTSEIGTFNGTITIYDQATEVKVPVTCTVNNKWLTDSISGSATYSMKVDTTWDTDFYFPIHRASPYPTTDGAFHYVIEHSNFVDAPADRNPNHPNEVISYNNGVITAHNAGTAILTIKHEETDEHFASQQFTCTLTVSKRTPVFTWNDPVYFNQTTISDYFITNNTDTDIKIESQSDTDVAVLYFNPNDDSDKHTLDLTTYYKETTPASSTTVTVSQAENYKWNDTTATHTITPENENKNNHVQFTLTQENYIRDFQVEYLDPAANNKTPMGPDWQNNGIYFGGEGALNGEEGWNWSEKYIIIKFSGIPDKLTFDASRSNAATGSIKLSVSEGTNKDNLTEIWSNSNNSTNDSIECKLNPETRFLKFSYTGNLWGLFKNINVTELNQFDAVPNSLDFGTVTLDDNPSKDLNFNLHYANAGYNVTLDLDRTGGWATEEAYNQAKQYIRIEPATITTIGGEKHGTVENIKVTLHSDDQTGYTIPANARLKISDEAGHTTYVNLSGKIEKSTQTITWNDYFSLQEPIQIPISTDSVRGAAKASSNLPVKYRSEDDAVIKVNDNGSCFIPAGVGTTTITAYQEGNNQYAYVESTKQVQVTGKSIQLINWTDDLSDLIFYQDTEDPDSIALTAQVYIIDVVNSTFEFSQEQTDRLVYTIAEGGESIIKITNDTLTMLGIGETTITVTIEADEHHEGATMTIPVIVREPAMGCEDKILITPPSQIEFFQMNTDEISKDAIDINRAEGVPGFLLFSHIGKQWTILGMNFYTGTIKAQQSTDGGNTWQDVADSEITPTLNREQQTDPIRLDRNATHIRFVRPAGGQGYHYVTNIKVVPVQYVEVEQNTIDFENINMGGVYQKTFTISYSNIKSPLIATTSSKDVTVTPNRLGECGQFGEQEIKVTWKPNNNKNQSVTFKDTLANLSVTVNLIANIQLRKQKIVWENPPTVIWDYTDIDNRPTHTRDVNNNELIDLPITYEVTEGTDCAYFEDNMFFIINAGSITIKASNPGNEEYLAVDSTYQITIQGIPPTFIGGAENDLWSTAANWVNSAKPNAEQTASITAPVTITNEDICVNKVRIASAGSIHITPSGGLTVGEGGVQCVTTDGSAIIIDNLHSGAGFFRISPAYAGELPRITMRYQTRSTLDNGANKNAEWQYIGAPGEDASVHVDYNTWLYRLDESQADWVLMPQQNNHTLDPFQGYALTQYGQPTYEWNAQMTNRNCIIPLTYHFDGRKGQNLIANSYTAPIDVTKMRPEDFQMIEGQSEYYDITQTLYLYNSGSWNAWHEQDSAGTGIKLDGNNTTPGQYYAIPVLAVAEGYIPERPTIAPMQGIYVRVRAKKTGGDTHVGNIIFDYDRIVMGEGHDMHRPMRAPKKSDITSIPSENFRRLRIVATSEHSGADRLYIIQDDINTRNYDNGYDAPNQATQDIVNIYTYESGGKMEVSCANNIDSTYIGFMAGEDRTYTLHFNAIIGETLCLQDLVSGEKIYIVEDGTYTFEAEPQSTNNKRFLLHAKKAINSDMEDVNAAHIWFSNHTLYVTNAADNSLLQLYDVSGHMIFSSIIHRTPYTVDLTHLTEGVYMARVNNQVYKFVCK